MTATVRAYAAPPTAETLAAQLGLPLESIVKLDANESPFGPPPAAMRVLLAPPSANRYPDPLATDLRAALADYTGVPAEGIVVGAGSDEVIALLAEALLGPGDEVIVSEPTFSVYGVVARRRGATVVDVPRDAAWRTPAEALAAAITPRTRLIFLCAPNNPTGTPLDREVLDTALGRAREFGDAAPIVVVDEAYYEMGALAGDPSAWTAAPLVAQAAGRLVVLRTFSKLFGLAGLRVGYGLMAPELAARLMALKAPYNVNAPALAAARAALDDLDWVSARARELASERARLASALTVLPDVQVYPSSANFLLAEVAMGAGDEVTREGRRDALWQALLAGGVMTRKLAGSRLGGTLRISVGLPEQNDRFLAALARCLEEQSA